MELEGRLRRANGSAEDISLVLFDKSEEVLLALLDNPRLNDDHLKVLLSRKDLGHRFLAELARRERLLRAHDVKLALVRHRRTPRHVSLVLLRHLYAFDLMALANTPSAPPELRRAVEEALAARVLTLPLGQRLSLAKRATARLAAAMLADFDLRVVRLALDSPRLTEDGVLSAIRGNAVSSAAVELISQHPRWSSRHEVKVALFRSPAASLSLFLSLIDDIPGRELADLVHDPYMPEERRRYLVRLKRTRNRDPGQTGPLGCPAGPEAREREVV